MASVHLCDNLNQLKVAVRTLSAASVVYFDCEGYELGHHDGSLAVISMGTVKRDQGGEHLSIFLIDVLAFEGHSNSRHLTPIFDIIQSYDITKVVFDGRSGVSELLHGSNVTLRRVIDLQIADITSREKRGETALQRLRRLRGFLPRREINTNPSLLREVQKLNGLVKALLEHGVKVEPKIRIDHSKWMERPLDADYQRYAAEDVHLVLLLHKALLDKGFINDSVEEQSARYVMQHARERPSPSDIYSRHGFLPLGVLKDIKDRGSLVFCIRCREKLPRDCFPPANKSKNAPPTVCYVCRAVQFTDR